MRHLASANDIESIINASQSLLSVGIDPRRGAAERSAAANQWGTPGLNSERLSLTARPPLAFPRAPWEAPRLYFHFGEPIDAGTVDANDQEACSALYSDVRKMVEECIRLLLSGRARDPFAAAPLRLLYETFSGKQAPSFIS